MAERAPLTVPLLVAGGGLGGLALAIALARRGRRVHVIEKNPEFTEVGAGLQIAPNASRVLDDLGVLGAIHEQAVFPEQLLWMDAVSGERLTTLDLGRPFVERYGYPYFVMHRHDLLDALLTAARADDRITLEPAKELVSIDDAGDAVLVTCADGSRYRAEILVGADGLWSTVRRFVHDDGDPICSEYVAYRGPVPIEEVPAHAGLENVTVWTGPLRHLVQYPIRRGELFNQVAVFKSYNYQPDSDDWGTPAELDQRFADSTPLVRDALPLFRRNRRWPMLDRLPIDSWTRNRVVLLGDAAHPMLQYLAQGACQAFEDVLCLANALAAHPGDDGAAFRAYEAERIPRTALVQTNARRWGAYWHLFPGPEKAARDAFLQARRPDDYTDVDWYYGYRVQANA
jgi:2-polyprenyl-6-methoxyphenol hydroxylase-like FAD-dependent oxidoreductase